MKQLKQSFRLNGLQDTLLNRNECVALFGVSGTYTEKVINYEVCVIRNDQYGEREAIAANSDFGRDRSRSFNNKRTALEYYEYLKEELRKERNLSKGVVKSIEGGEENAEVIPEYQPA